MKKAALTIFVFLFCVGVPSFAESFRANKVSFVSAPHAMRPISVSLNDIVAR